MSGQLDVYSPEQMRKWRESREAEVATFVKSDENVRRILFAIGVPHRSLEVALLALNLRLDQYQVVEPILDKLREFGVIGDDHGTPYRRTAVGLTVTGRPLVNRLLPEIEEERKKIRERLKK